MAKDEIKKMYESHFVSHYADNTWVKSRLDKIPKSRAEKVLSNNQLANEKSKFYILSRLLALDFSLDNFRSYIIQQRALSFFLKISENIEREREIKFCKRELERY